MINIQFKQFQQLAKKAFPEKIFGKHFNQRLTVITCFSICSQFHGGQ